MAAKDFFAELRVNMTLNPTAYLKEQRRLIRLDKKMRVQLSKSISPKINTAVFNQLTKGSNKARMEVLRLENTIGGLRAEVSDANKTIKTLTTATVDLGQKLSTANSKLAAAGGGARNFSRSVKSSEFALIDFDKMMSIALQKLIRYRIIMHAGRAILNAYKESITGAVSAMYQMSQIQKVMSVEMFQTERLWKTATETSIRYGISLDESIKGMKIWAQQGKNANEIVSLHNATLLLAATANLTATQAVEALTAATKAYKVDLSDLTMVVDAWMNVQRKHAVTAQDLANALKIVANAAQNVGVDFHDLNANVTAIVAVTRKSGTAVANSLKTMFSRFSRPVSQAAFYELGIAVQEQVGILRDFDDVLGDLYIKWDSLNDVQRTQIAYAMGGVRRYADFLALMENYGEKLQATTDSMSSYGEANRALNIELESMKKTYDSLAASASVVGLAIGNVFVGPGSSFSTIAKQLAAFTASNEKASRTLGMFLGYFGKTTAILAFVAIIRQLGKVMFNFSTEVGRNVAVKQVSAAVDQKMVAMSSKHIKFRISNLAMSSKELLAINLKKASTSALIAEEERLTAALAKQNIARISKIGLAGKGLFSAIGGFWGVGILAAFLIGDLIVKQRQKAQKATEDYMRMLTQEVEVMKQSVNIYDIYAKKINTAETAIKALVKENLDEATTHARINEILAATTQSFYYLRIEQEKLAKAGDETSKSVVGSINAIATSSEDALKKLGDLYGKMIQLGEEATAVQKELWTTLATLSRDALTGLSDFMGYMVKFQQSVMITDIAFPSTDASALSRRPDDIIPGEFVAAQSDLAAALEKPKVELPLGYLLDQLLNAKGDIKKGWNEMAEQAQESVLFFNSEVQEAVAKGGPIIGESIRKYFPEMAAKLNLDAIFSHYLQQIEQGTDEKLARRTLVVTAKAQLSGLAAQLGALQSVFGDVDKRLEDLEIRERITAAIGEYAPPAQAIAGLQEKWQTVMNRTFKILGSFQGGEIPVMELLGEALGMSQKDRDKWIDEQGKGLEGALKSLLGAAMDAAVTEFRNIPEAVRGGVSVGEIFNKIVAGVFEVHGLEAAEIEKVVKLLGVEYDLMLDRKTTQAEVVAQKEVELRYIDNTIKLLRKGGATEASIAETLHERLRVEKEIAWEKSEQTKLDEGRINSEFRAKGVMLDIDIKYQDILHKAERLLSVRQKTVQAENKLFRTLGKITGDTPSASRGFEIENQLKFLREISDEQEAINEQILEEYAASLDLADSEVARLMIQDKIFDINKENFKTTKKIQALEDEMRLLPLLSDLQKIQQYLKDMEKQWTTMIEGITGALVSLPSILQDMYDRETDWLKEIADAQDELNQRMADAVPGTENYRQQLAYIDSLSAKIRQAQQDVKKWTGAFEIAREVAVRMMEDIGKAYLKVLQDEMTETLKNAIFKNQKFDFHGEIVDASGIGSRAFYDAIIASSKRAYDILTGKTTPQTGTATSPGAATYDMAMGFGSLAVSMAQTNQITDSIEQALGMPMGTLSTEVKANTVALQGNTTAVSTSTVQEVSKDFIGPPMAGGSGEDPWAKWTAFINYLGVTAGTLAGGSKPGSAEGASFFGSATAMGIAAGGVSGPVAAFAPMVASIIGGLIGPKIFGDEKSLDLVVDAMDENTNAVKQNTTAMEELTQRLIHAPTTFTIPALAGLGGGGGGSLASQARLSGSRNKYLS